MVCSLENIAPNIMLYEMCAIVCLHNDHVVCRRSLLCWQVLFISTLLWSVTLHFFYPSTPLYNEKHDNICFSHVSCVKHVQNSICWFDFVTYVPYEKRTNSILKTFQTYLYIFYFLVCCAQILDPSQILCNISCHSYDGSL